MLCEIFEISQGSSEGVKPATWGVQPQGRNLKELPGEYYKRCGVLFNWILHQTPHQGRQQDEGQIKGFT